MTFAATGRHEDFLRFLCWEGLDDADVRRAVGPVRFADNAPLPTWCQTLSESLNCTGSDDMLTGRDPEHPLPFEDIYLPFVQVFWQRVQTVSEVDLVLAFQAQQDLSRGLLETLARAASDVLYAEFLIYQLQRFCPPCAVRLSRIRRIVPPIRGRDEIRRFGLVLLSVFRSWRASWPR